MLTSQGLSNIPHMSGTDLGMYVSTQTQTLCITHLCVCVRVQSLANVAWSFAKLNYFDGGLWGVLTSQGLSNIPCMSGTDLGMYLWATTQRLKADAAMSGLGTAASNVCQSNHCKQGLQKVARVAVYASTPAQPALCKLVTVTCTMINECVPSLTVISVPPHTMHQGAILCKSVIATLECLCTRLTPITLQVYTAPQ